MEGVVSLEEENRVVCIRSCFPSGIRAAESETAMERKYEVGQNVIYRDQYGGDHPSVVTAWWPDTAHYQPNTKTPGCNLVFVSTDETKNDPYGRQIERETSVVHRSNQPAPGRFWRWPDE